ncbi:twitching motility protein PilT [Bacteroidia bacterium]|nr:twitching motility protein PilT [Bacteroidia bacterium]
MKVLIDTNVVIDWLAEREPFVDAAKRVVNFVESGNLDGYISASSVTDIFYILNRRFNHDRALNYIRKIVSTFEVADTTTNILLHAIESNTHDFEDAVQSETAHNISAEYIVTRNTKDFLLSPIPALSPDALLEVLQA